MTRLSENYPEQTWTPAFIKLLLEMEKVKEKAATTEKEYHHKFDKNMMSLSNWHGRTTHMKQSEMRFQVIWISFLNRGF